MNLIVGNIQIHNKVVLWNHDSTELWYSGLLCLFGSYWRKA